MAALVQEIWAQDVDEKLIQITTFNFFIWWNCVKILVNIFFFLSQNLFEQEVSIVHSVHSLKVKVWWVLLLCVEPVVNELS